MCYSKLHPYRGIRVANDLWSGDMREVHPCQGIRFADSLHSGDMRKVPRGNIRRDSAFGGASAQPEAAKTAAGHNPMTPRYQLTIPGPKKIHTAQAAQM